MLQEALIQIWRHLPSYRFHGSLKAWLILIVINEAKQQFRKKRIRMGSLEETGTLADCEGSIEPYADRTLLRDELGGAVDAECVVNDVGVGLRRVEMGCDSVSVIAFARLPEHYGASAPSNVPGVVPAPPPPEYFAPARAQYTVDDVVFDAGYAGFWGDADAGRLWLIWDCLDPVPSEAGELTLFVTALGADYGTWEFAVPLV